MEQLPDTVKTKAILPETDLETARKLFADACKLHSADPSPETLKAVTVTLLEVYRIENAYEEAHWIRYVAKRAKQTCLRLPVRARTQTGAPHRQKVR